MNPRMLDCHRPGPCRLRQAWLGPARCVLFVHFVSPPHRSLWARWMSRTPVSLKPTEVAANRSSRSKPLGFDIPPLWRGHRRASLSSSVVRSFAPGTKICLSYHHRHCRPAWMVLVLRLSDNVSPDFSSNPAIWHRSFLTPVDVLSSKVKWYHTEAQPF